MNNFVIKTILIIAILTLTGCSQPRQLPKTTITDPKAEDLDYFCNELEQKHKNLYSRITKEDFQAARMEISNKLPAMSDSEFYYSLRNLLAQVGDAHTYLDYNESQYKHLSGLGFAVEKYSDGWHLMILEAINKQYLGYKLLAINNTDIEEVYEKSKTIISFENEAWLDQQFSNTINFKEALEYLGVITPGDAITLSIQRNGGSTVEQLNLEPRTEAEMENLKTARIEPKNLLTGFSQEIYRERKLNNNTYFIQYNSCQEDPDLSMKEFVKTVANNIKKNKYSTIVIDLRYNSGGNSMVFEPMIRSLQKLQNRYQFDVYTLIGKKTFSSAIINSIQTKDKLNSKLVGSQTGGNVNGYGEVKTFTLPNAPITVQYSTKYFELIKGYEKDSLYPDITAKQDYEHYLEGIDNELEVIQSMK